MLAVGQSDDLLQYQLNYADGALLDEKCGCEFEYGENKFHGVYHNDGTLILQSLVVEFL